MLEFIGITLTTFLIIIGIIYIWVAFIVTSISGEVSVGFAWPFILLLLLAWAGCSPGWIIPLLEFIVFIPVKIVKAIFYGPRYMKYQFMNLHNNFRFRKRR